MLSKFQCLIILLSLGVSMVSASGFELPIAHELNGLTVIELKIDGKKHKFLLDTGSNANFIDPSLVDELEKIKVLKRDKSLDTKVNTFSTKVRSKGYLLNLSVKGERFEDMKTYAMANKRFSKDKDGFDCCSGILGTEFLSKRHFEFDLENKELKISKKEFKNKIPFKIVGRNVLQLSCKLSGKPIDLRLDSGSEVPLIFHTGFSKNNLLMERAYSSGYRKGPLFIRPGKIICGDTSFETDSFVYQGGGGALAHSFVDGNLGPQFLGKKYSIDFKKKIIFVNISSKSVSVGMKSYPVDLSVDHKKSEVGSLMQGEALMVKSCANKDGFKKCLEKWCEIKGRSCPSIKEDAKMDDVLSVFFPKKDFSCSSFKMLRSLYKDPLKYDYCWWKRTVENNIKEKFVKKKKYQKLIPPMNIDNKVSFIIPMSQSWVTSNLYCLAIYSNIITMDKIPPLYFSLSIKGASFSRDQMKGYSEWLKSYEGEKCLSWISNLFPKEKHNPKELFSGKNYITVVNPITILGDGVEGFDKEFSKNSNHERLHAFYAENKTARNYAKKKWTSLSKEAKEKFKKDHPSYNFSDEKILLKEFFSYSFDENIKGLKSID